MTTDLFQPVRLGALDLPNRIVMAPMTRSRADSAGVQTPLAATYYAQRATAGLMVTEATQVSRQGQGYAWTPGIHDPAQVEAWRHVTDAVHAAGGRIALQLWHVGRVSHESFQNGGQPVAPTAIAPEGKAFTEAGFVPFTPPRALETDEIPGIVADFRRGAENARQAGFDAVEVHGANGYLIDQFLRDGSNHRTDRYGGSIANRARFLMEVTEAVVAVWGADRVGVRVSPVSPFNTMSDSDPQALFGHVAEALSGLGIAFLHVVEGEPGQPSAVDFGALRRAFRGAYIANKGYDLDRAQAVLREGRADLVAFGTAYIGNPDLVARLRRGAPLAAADKATFYGGDAKGYTDYRPLEAAA
jgi:N-ethylmaleimide reductase